MNKLLFLTLIIVSGYLYCADNQNNQILINAAKHGNIEEVQRLLKNGADVNAKDNNGDTALMWASSKGHANVVQLLLDASADVNAKNDYGFTALMCVPFNGHTDVVKLLLDAGADVNAKDDYYGDTALIWASGKGHTEIVKLLKEYSKYHEEFQKYIANYAQHVQIELNVHLPNVLSNMVGQYYAVPSFREYMKNVVVQQNHQQASCNCSIQ